MDKLIQWERKIAEFESLSRETLPDIIKRAIISERAPQAVRTHLLVNAHTLSSYTMVRGAVEVFVTAGRKWGRASERIDGYEGGRA